MLKPSQSSKRKRRMTQSTIGRTLILTRSLTRSSLTKIFPLQEVSMTRTMMMLSTSKRTRNMVLPSKLKLLPQSTKRRKVKSKKMRSSIFLLEDHLTKPKSKE